MTQRLYRRRATTEELYEDYTVRKLSLRAIAEKYGYANAASASKIIQLRGIAVRSRKGLAHFYRPPHKLPGAKLEGEALGAVLGLCLGDGHVTPSGPSPHKNSYLVANYSEKHREYVQALAGLLGPWVSSIQNIPARPSKLVPASLPLVRIQSIAHPEFTRLRALFYLDGEKRVPAGLPTMEGADALTLAVFVMDDGSFLHGKKGNGNVQLSTQGFPLQDQLTIQDWLARFGLTASIVSCNGGYGHLIHLRTGCTPLLRELLLPYFPRCMYYKLGC